MRYRILYIDPSRVPEVDMFTDDEREVSMADFVEVGTVEASTPKAAWRRLHTVPEVGMVNALGAEVRDVNFGDVLVDEQGNAVQFVIPGEAPAFLVSPRQRGTQGGRRARRVGNSASVGGVG